MRFNLTSAILFESCDIALDRVLVVVGLEHLNLDPCLGLG